MVLLSLDGAGTEVLHQLYREGALPAGGFARFFQDGEVADRLIPVDPALTATNHISLATGYAAGRTGIVGNNFHVAGTPWLDTVSGFAAPIGTETLWEAARRQGKRVGVLTWPGADDKGPRRRGDCLASVLETLKIPPHPDLPDGARPDLYRLLAILTLPSWEKVIRWSALLDLDLRDLVEIEVAHAERVTVKTVQRWRGDGEGPPYRNEAGFRYPVSWYWSGGARGVRP